jgi:hypothetical protein
MGLERRLLQGDNKEVSCGIKRDVGRPIESIRQRGLGFRANTAVVGIPSTRPEQTQALRMQQVSQCKPE